MLAIVEAIPPPELMPTEPRSCASCLAFDSFIVLFDYLSGVCLSTIQFAVFCPGTVDISDSFAFLSVVPLTLNPFDRISFVVPPHFLH